MDDDEGGGVKDPERERRQEPRHDHDAERDHDADARFIGSSSFRRRPAPGKSNSAYRKYAGVVPMGEHERVDWRAARAVQLAREKERDRREPTVLDPGALQDLGFEAWDQTDVLERAWARPSAAKSQPAQPAAEAQPAQPAATASARVLRLVPPAPDTAPTAPDKAPTASGLPATAAQARPASPLEIAAGGFAGPAAPLPHRAEIQRAFGRHDVSAVTAHVGGPATAAADALGAEAYASGDHVAFRTAPDLHTAAHETAHVFQQRSGVSLRGGLGEDGDAHEQHADQVADAVVRGESAERLLDAAGGSNSGGAQPGSAVQRKGLRDRAGAAAGKLGNAGKRLDEGWRGGPFELFGAKVEAGFNVEAAVKKKAGTKDVGHDITRSLSEAKLNLLAQNVATSFVKNKKEVELFEHVHFTIEGSVAEASGGPNLGLGVVKLKVEGVAPELLDRTENDVVDFDVHVQGYVKLTLVHPDLAIAPLRKLHRQAVKQAARVAENTERLEQLRARSTALARHREVVERTFKDQLKTRRGGHLTRSLAQRSAVDRAIGQNRAEIRKLVESAGKDLEALAKIERKSTKLLRSVRGEASRALARSIVAMTRNVVGRAVLKILPIIGWLMLIADLYDAIKAIVAAIQACGQLFGGNGGEGPVGSQGDGSSASGGEGMDASAAGGEGSDPDAGDQPEPGGHGPDIDAPKEASIQEERATIAPDRPAGPSGRGEARGGRGGPEARPGARGGGIDAPKQIDESRATIDPDLVAAMHAEQEGQRDRGGHEDQGADHGSNEQRPRGHSHRHHIALDIDAPKQLDEARATIDPDREEAKTPSGRRSVAGAGGGLGLDIDAPRQIDESRATIDPARLVATRPDQKDEVAPDPSDRPKPDQPKPDQPEPGAHELAHERGKHEAHKPDRHKVRDDQPRNHQAGNDKARKADQHRDGKEKPHPPGATQAQKEQPDAYQDATDRPGHSGHDRDGGDPYGLTGSDVHTLVRFEDGRIQAAPEDIVTGWRNDKRPRSGALKKGATAWIDAVRVEPTGAATSGPAAPLVPYRITLEIWTVLPDGKREPGTQVIEGCYEPDSGHHFELDRSPSEVPAKLRQAVQAGEWIVKTSKYDLKIDKIDPDKKWVAVTVTRVDGRQFLEDVDGNRAQVTIKRPIRLRYPGPR